MQPLLRYAPTSVSGALRSTTAPFALRSLAGYIDGAWVPAASGATFALRSPADASAAAPASPPLALIPDMGAADTRAAIAAAAAAFPAWAARPAPERCAALRRIADALRAQAPGVAVLLALESGKPLEEARGEVAYAADYFQLYAEEGARPQGEVLTPARADRAMLTSAAPVGPAALLTPWNFPAAMPARKLAPALAAGCTVVLRPAAETPLTAMALVQLAHEAGGLPRGVLNLVVGRDHEATAGVLTASADIRKVSFTGSTRVGRLLMAQCAPTLKRLGLELGGAAPFIVFEDADLDAAVEGAMAAKFRNAGQTCVCANAFFVHRSVVGEFTARLAARVAALRVGDGLVEGTQVGPLISAAAVAAMEALVAEAVAGGAVVAAGGARVPGGGNFFQPTVLAGLALGSGSGGGGSGGGGGSACATSLRCVREEVFGPIAPIVSFDSEAQVVAAANASPYGLAAYVFTGGLSRAWRVSGALGVGMVGVNTGLISSALAPFGGVKDSGFGREGGRAGLAEYQSTKYTMMGI